MIKINWGIQLLLLKLMCVVVVKWNCVSYPPSGSGYPGNGAGASISSRSLEHHHTLVQFSGIPSDTNIGRFWKVDMKTILKLVIFITLSHCTYGGATWRSWRHTARKPWGFYKDWFFPTANLFSGLTWTSTLTTIIIPNWPMSSSVKGIIPAFSFTQGKCPHTVLQYSVLVWRTWKLKILGIEAQE